MFCLKVFAQNSRANSPAASSKPTTVSKGGDNRPYVAPGCANPPKGIKLSECCLNFPKFFSKEIIANNCSQICSKAQKVSGECCSIDCHMNTFGVLTDGKFDAIKAKVALANLTANNTAWTSVVRANHLINF